MLRKSLVFLALLSLVIAACAPVPSGGGAVSPIKVGAIFDLTGATDIAVRYWKWYSNDQGNNPGEDYWDVDVTNDGGQTWEEVTIDEEGGYHLNAMVRFEDGRRLIAGEAGYSYRSYDDGETWELMDMPYLGSMWGALRTENDCVLFFGLRDDMTVVEITPGGGWYTEILAPFLRDEGQD